MWEGRMFWRGRREGGANDLEGKDGGANTLQGKGKTLETSHLEMSPLNTAASYIFLHVRHVPRPT